QGPTGSALCPDVAPASRQHPDGRTSARASCSRLAGISPTSAWAQRGGGKRGTDNLHLANIRMGATLHFTGFAVEKRRQVSTRRPGERIMRATGGLISND